MQKFTNRAPSFKKKCKISGNHLNLSGTKASEQQWQSHTNNKTTKPEKYEKRNAELTKEYECQFGPLSPNTGHGKEWTKGPWPWEPGAN